MIVIEAIAFVFVLTCSGIFSKILYSVDLGPFKPIRTLIAGFGIIIHESSHVIVCLFTGVKISEINFLTRSVDPNSGERYLHGHVGTKYPERASFMQSFLVSLAPLFISTWLFFLCLNIAFTEELNDFINIIAGLACISLIFGASPSSADWKFLPRDFSRDPLYSVYQIFLITLSFFLVWLIITSLGIKIYSFINFILIGIVYYGLKYGILGISKGIESLRTKRPQKFKYGKFTRRTHKPSQSQVEEAHWY